jgi:hypothetical protein
MSGDLMFNSSTMGQLKLPGIKEISSREENFRNELKEKVLSGELVCARDVALFSYRQAFRPTKSAKPVLQELLRAGKIASVPPLSCRTIFTDKTNGKLLLL